MEVIVHCGTDLSVCLGVQHPVMGGKGWEGDGTQQTHIHILMMKQDKHMEKGPLSKG